MNSMKKIALILALLGIGATLADPASARGGRVHSRVGVFVGVPIGFGLGWPYWYYPPPYYYPPYANPVVVVPQPQTYIQQDAPAAPAAPAQAYWYYCADSQAYYPYVKECPAGWQRVTPQPPS